MINPESKEWREFMAAALMAQFVLIPQPIDPDEPIPGSDDLNEGEGE